MRCELFFKRVLLKYVCLLDLKDWYADALAIGFYLVAVRYGIPKSIINDVLFFDFFLELHIIKHTYTKGRELKKVHITAIQFDEMNKWRWREGEEPYKIIKIFKLNVRQRHFERIIK